MHLLNANSKYFSSISHFSWSYRGLFMEDYTASCYCMKEVMRQALETDLKLAGAVN